MSRGREQRSEGRPFQTEGPTIEKALCCLVAVRARGTTKSPLNAERRDRRPEQAEVKLQSTLEINQLVFPASLGLESLPLLLLKTFVSSVYLQAGSYVSKYSLSSPLLIPAGSELE